MSIKSSDEVDQTIRHAQQIELPPELQHEGGVCKSVWIDLASSYDELRMRLETEAMARGFRGRNIETLFVTRSPERGHPCRIVMVVQ